MVKVAESTAFSTMKMMPDSKRCGWYGAYFMMGAYTLSFKSLAGSETYCMNGLGDNQAIDLSPYFAAADTVFLTPTPQPGGPLKVTTSIPPGVVGTCAFPLAVMVRDFSVQHPDFGKPDMIGDLALKGLVLNAFSVSGTVGLTMRRPAGPGSKSAGGPAIRIDVNARRLQAGRPGNGIYFHSAEGPFLIPFRIAFRFGCREFSPLDLEGFVHQLAVETGVTHASIAKRVRVAAELGCLPGLRAVMPDPRRSR
ncbi:MAG: hypothetical protein JWO30_4504 [Fibrobacteres bacterium]|nr:hypothetical protein [Fibrobacterota bacterium]